MALGEAFIRVEFDLDESSVAGVRRDADQILDAVEKEMDVGGKKVGKKLADSTSEELGKHGPQMGKAIEGALSKTKVRVKIKTEYDSEGRTTKRVVEEIIDEIFDSVEEATRPGGPVSRIGSAIQDAVGAGFNVSGRSPLIALLIPLIGAIVALVVGAVQAVGALAAILAIIPSLIAAIGIEAGIVFIAFQGVGDAIGKAFAAKNAKELREALKGLEPAAQDFVTSLLPIKKIFEDIKFVVQEQFFREWGTSLASAAKALAPLIVPGFSATAAALGQFFKALTDFFASPTFLQFVKSIFPATIEFLNTFGPQFVTFLTGLIDTANAAMPFLDRFGKIIGGILEHIGTWLSENADKPEFLAWLDDMADTLDSITELFFTLMDFVRTLLDELNQAGGRNVIAEFSDAFSKLILFLQSPIGKKALEGIINFSLIAIRVLLGITVGILGVIALFEFMGEAINAFFTWLIETAGPAVATFFTETLPDMFRFLGTLISVWVEEGKAKFEEFRASIVAKFTRIKDAIVEKFEAARAFVAGIPDKIKAFFADIGTWLFQAGRNLLSGLINGITSKIPDVGGIMSQVAATVTDFWPFSPAKKGPLSGEGDPFLVGRRVVDRFAAGMMTEMPTLQTASSEATSNVIFGPNSIGVNFNGALPTQDQATSTGSAVGTGILSQLAARNTRLAVRTL